MSRSLAFYPTSERLLWALLRLPVYCASLRSKRRFHTALASSVGGGRSLERRRIDAALKMAHEAQTAAQAAAALSSLNSDALGQAQPLPNRQIAASVEALHKATAGPTLLTAGDMMPAGSTSMGLITAGWAGHQAYPMLMAPTGKPADASPRDVLGKRPRTEQPCKQGWTRHEDATILRMVREVGTKWSRIAAQLPGRSDDAVRNRYIRIQV